MKKTGYLSCALLLSILLLSIFSGCAPARKPTEQERVVVPEVTKVFVEEQELSQAPAVVKDFAKRFAGEEIHLALETDGNVWILVNEDEDDRLEVKEAVQRAISQDMTILEIKLVEIDEDEKRRDQDLEPLVAKLSLDSLNSGIIFTKEEEKEEKQTIKREAEQTAKSEKTAAKAKETKNENINEQSVFRVDQPKPNETIESPVTVSGEAREANSTVTIRLRDNSGNILAESETLTDSKGKFNISLQFEKPAEQKQGKLEVFVRNAPGGSSANTVVIPVAFK